MVCHRDIDFFFAANREDRLKSVFGEADNIHYVHLNSNGSVKRLLLNYPNIINQYRIDYAHFQYVSPLVKRCNEIVTIHDLLFMDFPMYFPRLYRYLNEYLFRRSAKRANLVLTVSDYSRDAIACHFQIDKKRIHITYNSILPPNHSGNNIEIKSKFGVDKYILTVSRIEPRKNHLALLTAFTELKLASMGYKLVMVGAKDLKYTKFFDYYNKLDNETKSCILFLEVSFDDLVALYQHASLFVFPSLAEGFGIPPLEALVYGSPLLCSNATAMAEFDFPEEISFNPSNIDDLKAKIIKLLANPANIESIRRKILEKYNWDRIADGFYNLLKYTGSMSSIDIY